MWRLSCRECLREDDGRGFREGDEWNGVVLARRVMVRTAEVPRCGVAGLIRLVRLGERERVGVRKRTRLRSSADSQRF